MKLHRPTPRAEQVHARDVILGGTDRTKQSFDYRREISPKLKELMLEYIDIHDRYLLAVGLNCYLFDPEEWGVGPKVRGWEMGKEKAVSTLEGNELLFSIAGSVDSNYLLFGLHHMRPLLQPGLPEMAAKKVWPVIKQELDYTAARQPAHVFANFIGANGLLPPATPGLTELRTVANRLAQTILSNDVPSLKGTDSTDILTQESDLRDRAEKLFLIGLSLTAFPEYRTNLKLPESFFDNLREFLRECETKSASLYAQMAVYTGEILARTDEPRLARSASLPQRLLA